MILEQANIILPRDIISLLNKLEESGYEAYVVGGAVRDSLLERTINDYDITTNATPDEICEVFKDYQIIPTGLQHGTVTVVIDKNSYEITTYRSESGYTDGRHPDGVKFIKSLEEDLSRRDFTINALACDVRGNVIDYHSGIEDLRNKVIRCVGDPDTRFEEDYLRILRAVRFSAQLSFVIESNTAISMIKNRLGLYKISKERIRVELNKMMRAPDSKFLCDLLKQFKLIMLTIIPELDPTVAPINEISHHDKSIYNHLCNVVGNIETPDYLLRMAAFLHDIGKPATMNYDAKKQRITFYEHDIKGAEIAYNILRRLRYTKEEIEEIVLLIRYHNDPTKIDIRWVRRKLNRFEGNEARLRKLFILKLADVRDHKYFKTWQFSKYNQLNALVDQIIKEDQCFSLKKMAVNGYDMIELGFKGKEIGAMLDILLRLVIDEKLENCRPELLAYALKRKKGLLKLK